jgi:hypothetical protein
VSSAHPGVAKIVAVIIINASLICLPNAADVAPDTVAGLRRLRLLVVPLCSDFQAKADK